MKTNLILGLIFFSFAIFGQEYTFPENLKVDPTSYEIRQLGLKRIEQSITSVYPALKDPEQMDSFYMMVYMVDFDSLGRVRSFKYDFHREIGRTLFSGSNSGVEIMAYNDSSRLEEIHFFGVPMMCNYVENVFSYDEFNQLKKVDVIQPYRGGIIDGVYLKDRAHQQKTIDEEYLFGQLTCRTTYLDGELYLVERFEYEYFTKVDMKVPLICLITKQYATSTEKLELNYHW